MHVFLRKLTSDAALRRSLLKHKETIFSNNYDKMNTIWSLGDQMVIILVRWFQKEYKP